MLEEKDYQSLDEIFLFVAAFIDWTTISEKTAPKTFVHTRSVEFAADMRGDIAQCAWGVDNLRIMENKVHDFKQMLADMSEEHCDSELYTLNRHLRD